jgi:hypothetical protein
MPFGRGWKLKRRKTIEPPTLFEVCAFRHQPWVEAVQELAVVAVGAPVVKPVLAHDIVRVFYVPEPARSGGYHAAGERCERSVPAKLEFWFAPHHDSFLDARLQNWIETDEHFRAGPFGTALTPISQSGQYTCCSHGGWASCFDLPALSSGVWVGCTEKSQSENSSHKYI